MRTIPVFLCISLVLLACSDRQAEVVDKLCEEYRAGIEHCDNLDIDSLEERCGEGREMVKERYPDCTDLYDEYLLCEAEIPCDLWGSDENSGTDSLCYDVEYAAGVCFGTVDPDEWPSPD